MPGKPSAVARTRFRGTSRRHRRTRELPTGPVSWISCVGGRGPVKISRSVAALGLHPGPSSDRHFVPSRANNERERKKGRPVELLQQDRGRMIGRPSPSADHRAASPGLLPPCRRNDCSVDPSVIGRFIDITATGTTVTFRTTANRPVNTPAAGRNAKSALCVREGRNSPAPRTHSLCSQPPRTSPRRSISGSVRSSELRMSLISSSTVLLLCISARRGGRAQFSERRRTPRQRVRFTPSSRARPNSGSLLSSHGYQRSYRDTPLDPSCEYSLICGSGHARIRHSPAGGATARR